MPLQFGIYTPKAKEHRSESIPRWVTERRDWVEKTWRMMGYEMDEEGEIRKLIEDGEDRQERPMDRLARLKQAMHLACREVRWEVRNNEEWKVQEEFSLPTAVAALQALRDNCRGRAHRLLVKLPGFSKWDTEGPLIEVEGKLLDYIQERALEEIDREMLELDREEGEEGKKRMESAMHKAIKT